MVPQFWTIPLTKKSMTNLASALALGKGSSAGSLVLRTVTPDHLSEEKLVEDDRYQARSTILTSQLPVSRWHEQIGDPPLADGILDRLVHNAHRIEMRGDSMRKNRPKGTPQG